MKTQDVEGNGHFTRKSFVAAFVAVLAACSSAFLAPLPRDQDTDRITLRDHGVPRYVVETVARGEKYAHHVERSQLRQAVEHTQNEIAEVFPAVAVEADFSLTSFGVKPSTLGRTFDLAKQRGLLVGDGSRDDFVLAMVACGDADAVAAWQAGVVLLHLRESHPVLRTLTWEQIVRDPSLVAKLYSGYVGGDDQSWRDDCDPGPVAERRLGHRR